MFEWPDEQSSDDTRKFEIGWDDTTASSIPEFIPEDTFVGRAVQMMGKLPYHGFLNIKKNNLMCVNSLSWFRGVPEGRYAVWANQCRAVFFDAMIGAVYIVFPGV